MPNFKWLPQPLLSLTLLLTWLLVWNSLALGQLVLGAIVAIAIPMIAAPFWPDPPKVRKPVLLLRFAMMVLIDIVAANLTVAKLILVRSPRTLQSRFVHLPLDLDHDFAITLLANTISLTPGTISSELSRDRRNLLIHCLDLDNETTLIMNIKSRYEAPLKQVFETC
jgi:multicomponent K+:H+ antiporter subunit E